MSVPNEWERYVYLGSSDGVLKLVVEQGLAFRELVLYTRDDRTVIAREPNCEYDVKQVCEAITEGCNVLKQKRIK